MPNQYTSEKKTLGELLSLTSPSIHVPDWQRSYSWTIREVETFWQDLLSFSAQYPDANINKQEYFLGSIVLVNSGTSNELLDGQQRLATATILLSVICEQLRQFKEDAAIRTLQKYISEIDDAKGDRSYKLTLNIYDRDFFRQVIQDSLSGSVPCPNATLDSHRSILSAREYFERQFNQEYNKLGGGEKAYQWALRIRMVLTDHMSVVSVSSTDEDNAANVFETLNDRGIGLSTPDLLRSLLLRRAKDQDRDEIIECWEVILGLEKKVEAFLRHFWLSRNGDVKTRSLYREIKGKITKNKTDSLEMSRELKKAANVYADLVSAVDDDPNIMRLLDAVKMLGANALYPALLSAYDVGKAEQIRRLLQKLLTYFVRHNVIGNLENSILESTIYGLAVKLWQDKDFDNAVRTIRAVSPTDNEFESKFRVTRIRRLMTARYLLREIEHYRIRTGELSVEYPDKVHLEHIYPQSPREGETWNIHDAVVNRLGNLTLLAKKLNIQAKNAPFTEKKKYYQESMILLTKELLEHDDWDLEKINERQEKMAKDALVVWPFVDVGK